MEGFVVKIEVEGSRERILEELKRLVLMLDMENGEMYDVEEHILEIDNGNLYATIDTIDQ